MDKNYKPRRKVVRQNWKPGPGLTALRRIWMAVFSVLKIVIAAIATVCIIGGVCLLVFVNTLGDYLEQDVLPNANEILDNTILEQSSYAYYLDSNGNIQELQKLYADVDQQWVNYEDIPESLIHAAVAIEDKRFFEHQGVDWFPTIKACINMFTGSRSQFGGSSITQQLVKNSTGDKDVTVQRKVLEIFKATQLEKRYDKTTIMEYYLNIIFLGNRCSGVKAAAATYFGKELEFLTPAESACIISITNNPSKFNPYRTTLDKEGKTGLEQNKERRTNILYEMRNQGYLSEEEYQEALNQELVFKRGIDEGDRVADCENESCGYHGKVSTFVKKDNGQYYCPQCDSVTSIGENANQEVYSWFMDTLLEDVGEGLAPLYGVDWEKLSKKERQEFISSTVAKGGYHIYTTFDYEAQKAIDNVYQDLSKIPTVSNLKQLQSGIVLIDNKTGDIVAMAGGVGDEKGFDDFNRATDAHLQPGSSLKPLTVYAPAFELGLITPATVIRDLPLNYSDGKPYPRNDDFKYSGSRTILSALISSVNAVAVNTLDTMGLQYSYNFGKEKFRLSTLTNNYVTSSGKKLSDVGYSPLGMGAPTVGVTVRDMSAAFATFANKGVYRTARTYTKVYNSQGELVLDNTQESEQIISEKTANYVSYCLDQAVAGGTGTMADLKNIGVDVAGKTGSTSSYKDRWFCGYTSNYTAAVWCGFDQPEAIHGVGQNPAARLWKMVMEPLHKGKTTQPLYSEEGMVQVEVCLDCGKLATDACKLDARTHDTGLSRIGTALVMEEDVPMEDCDCHIVVDFCSECNAVANDACKALAAEGALKLEKRSLVRKTMQEVQEITDALRCGLWSQFNADNYIYMVDGAGQPAAYKGLNGNRNAGVNAPYLVCDKHTAVVDNGSDNGEEE